MRETQRQHQAKGWRDIAYNVAVGDHDTFEGIGIGVRHLNEDAGGSGTIVLLGNFQETAIPAAMIERTAQLVAHGLLAGWWSVALTGGHRDLEATACPGRHAYAAIPQINARATQIITELGGVPPIPQEAELNAYETALLTEVHKALVSNRKAATGETIVHDLASPILETRHLLGLVAAQQVTDSDLDAFAASLASQIVVEVDGLSEEEAVAAVKRALREGTA